MKNFFRKNKVVADIQKNEDEILYKEFSSKMVLDLYIKDLENTLPLYDVRNGDRIFWHFFIFEIYNTDELYDARTGRWKAIADRYYLVTIGNKYFGSEYDMCQTLNKLAKSDSILLDEKFFYKKFNSDIIKNNIHNSLILDKDENILRIEKFYINWLFDFANGEFEARFLNVNNKGIYLSNNIELEKI